MGWNVNEAERLFGQGYNCAQAVLAAFSEVDGISEAEALAVASGFGGGMGRLGEVCGAMTGAFMVLGLRYGKTAVADPDVKVAVYAHVQAFAARFRAAHGSLLCRDLLGCDLGTEEGRKDAADRGLHTSVCAPLVREIAEWLEEDAPALPVIPNHLVE
jgi:C_GCAxxG_C_C family probable redox protein